MKLRIPIRPSPAEHVLFWRLRRACSDALEIHPQLYATVQELVTRYTAEHTRRIVRPDTDVVIEGFPRSANTFVWYAYRTMYDSKTTSRIAVHFHSPAQIHLGIRWRIPTILLIRDPDEAVISLTARMLEKAGSGDRHYRDLIKPEIINRYMSYWLKRYTTFYEELLYARNYVAVGEFSQVTNDIEGFLKGTMRRYNLDTDMSYDFQELQQLSRRREKLHIFPSEYRDGIKEELKWYYCTNMDRDTRQVARTIYGKFVHNVVT